MKQKLYFILNFWLVVILAFALLFSPYAVPVRAQESNDPPEQLIRRATATAAKFLQVEKERIIISDIQWNDAWATGYIVVIATETSDPDLYVFIAQKTDASWRISIEGQARFSTALYDLPEEFQSPYLFDQPQEDGEAGFSQIDSDIMSVTKWVEQPELSFPWTQGYSWKLTGGPHNNSDTPAHPWSSLDFSPGTSGKWEVRAAAAGTVQYSSSCKNFVLIKHSGGWQTGYYHLDKIAVKNGQYVERGTYLGKASALFGCGGSAVGAHVHFSLRKNGVKQEWKNRYIGGYYVKEGTSPYAGKLQHVVTGTSIAKGSNVKNNGYIGLGIPATPAANLPSGLVIDPNLTFSWGTTKGAIQYTLQIASDTEFLSIVENRSTTGNNIFISTLPNGDYYWRVRGENFSHAGPWSSVLNFTLDPNAIPTETPAPTETPVPTETPPAPIIVNPSLTPSFGSTCTTAWYKVTGTGYGGTNLYLTMNTNVSSQSTNSAIWRPNIPLAGRYKVEAYIGHHTAFTWPCTPKNYLASDTSQARYRVYHPAAPSGTSIYINQKPLDNAWAPLGEYYFDVGTGGYIQLKDFNGETNLSRSISFNVVRLTWVGP